MTHWLVTFEDSPAMVAIRAARAAAHHAYLANHADRISRPARAEGRNTDCWLVKEQSYEAVEELVVGDPFFAPSLRHYAIQPLDR